MYKINKANIYFVIILLFIFQPFVENFIPPFKYYDEILLILFTGLCLLKNKFRFHRKTMKMVTLILIFIGIGFLGNIISGSNQRIFAIVQDIVSNLKFPLFSLVIYRFKISENEQNQLENHISKLIRFLFIIMFTCSIITQFIDIGMGDRIRYGFTSFKFIYKNPAGLNAYFYLFIILFTITLYKNGHVRKHSTFYMLMGIVAWVLTLRTRAITFAVLYIALYVFVIRFKKKREDIRFRWYQIIPATVGVLLLSWDSIDAYFISNDKTARALLLNKSIQIAKDYFPLGTGFGTFGTEASRAFYSSVYVKYGLSHLYGMSPEYPMYLVEQFWFGVLGQFGCIGFIIYIFFIYYVFENIWKNLKKNSGHQFAAITFFFTTIFSSVTAATFIQSSIMPSIMIFALLRRTNR